jgi:hypothetical protein
MRLAAIPVRFLCFTGSRSPLYIQYNVVCIYCQTEMINYSIFRDSILQSGS